MDNKKKNQWKAWLYLAPTVVLLLIFTVWPMINTLRMSVLEGYDSLKEIGGASFSFGFDNFKQIVEFYRFKDCMLTTILLTFITVPVSTLLALVIAVALNSIKFVKKTLQTIFFLPYVTNTIAIGMVFMAMFNRIPVGDTYSYGIINNIIQAFGGEPVNWINGGSSYWANIAVVSVYIIWNALPFKILVLLGGLQGVNKQYYDAAKVDGTSRFRTFWRITVPLLSPMIAYVVITGFIGGFKEYSSVLGIFGPSMGPGNHEMDTMVGLIYESVSEQQGQASAAALILFVIIFAVTMINMYVSKKKVHY